MGYKRQNFKKGQTLTAAAMNSIDMWLNYICGKEITTAKIINGELVFTFSDGNTLNVGKVTTDGVSPTVDITDIEGGKRITITDKNGAHTFDIMDGKDGAGGGGSTEGAVLYIPQKLTEEQKAQARANIGLGQDGNATTSKLTTISGIGEIKDCVDGDMTITGFTLPEGRTEMVVTARKSINILDPDLMFRNAISSEWRKLAQDKVVTTKGLTITFDNGIVTVNGTATAQVNIPILGTEGPLWLKAGVYQFAGCPDGGSASTYGMLWKHANTDVSFWLDYGMGTGNPNKTFTEDVPVRANIIVYSGYTCDNLQFKAQLLAGLPNTDRSGWEQFFPFEGESVILTSDSTTPIYGLSAFKGYTAIDCVGGSVTLEYPTSTAGSGDEESGDLPENVVERHHDDAEFTVTKLNNSIQFSQNGITFVGDELWMSKENSTYYDNGTMIFRYKVINGEFTLVGTCDCDFGHLNTMDYCEANDCLIFGNGGNGTETTDNYFVVVKNPRSLGSTALISDVGIKYDVDIGFKVQALWGGSNLGDNNVVYLLSNNSANITKILLLKDENGDFNGEFVTLESHELEAWGVQDADIFGDTLYIGGQIGGEHAAVKEISLSDYSTKGIVKRKFYDTNGAEIITCVQGIYVDDDSVWLCVNTNDTTKPVCLTKYRRDSSGSNTSEKSLSEIVPSEIASHYQGKYVSFYGDSITTFKGYVPEGNVCEYTGTTLGVSSVQQTWWKIVTDTLGMNLLVNNSWSGRCVTTVRDSDANHLNSAGCRMENVQILKTAERNPDIIIVKLGVNDFMRIGGVTLGSYDATAAVPTEPSDDFSNAYALMLNNIRTAFPNAELWCCTINQMSRKAFPNTVGNVSLYEINNTIIKLAEIWGAKVIRHDECGITVFNGETVFGDYANNMGLHPNATGHKLLAETTIRTMLSK